MNTTTIHINTLLYNEAAEYARRHNTNVDILVENYIMALMTIMTLDDMVEVPGNRPFAEKKSQTERKAWQNQPVSEETMRMLPKRRV